MSGTLQVLNVKERYYKISLQGSYKFFNFQKLLAIYFSCDKHTGDEKKINNKSAEQRFSETECRAQTPTMQSARASTKCEMKNKLAVNFLSWTPYYPHTLHSCTCSVLCPAKPPVLQAKKQSTLKGGFFQDEPAKFSEL